MSQYAPPPRVFLDLVKEMPFEFSEEPYVGSPLRQWYWSSLVGLAVQRPMSSVVLGTI